MTPAPAGPARALRAFVLSLSLPLALAACNGCKKGEPADDSPKPAELPTLTDEPTGAKKPVEGAKLDDVKEADRARFEVLADQLPSPCGKAHSLRTSRNTDAACVRARFGVDYLLALLADGATDDEIKELYMARYPRERKQAQFKVDPAIPHVGPDDARVVVVEFFDYGCPACGSIAPVIAEVAAAYPRDVAVYYKMFPLAAHPDSGGAAQAAIAAHKQGKFKAMHELLFGDQFNHKRETLEGYATKIGLDMARYQADYLAAEALVEADKAEGNTAGVQGTPAIFIDGVMWEGPGAAKYMKTWIDEQLALNR